MGHERTELALDRESWSDRFTDRVLCDDVIGRACNTPLGCVSERRILIALDSAHITEARARRLPPVCQHLLHRRRPASPTCAFFHERRFTLISNPILNLTKSTLRTTTALRRQSWTHNQRGCNPRTRHHPDLPRPITNDISSRHHSRSINSPAASRLNMPTTRTMPALGISTVHSRSTIRVPAFDTRTEVLRARASRCTTTNSPDLVHNLASISHRVD